MNVPIADVGATPEEAIRFYDIALGEHANIIVHDEDDRQRWRQVHDELVRRRDAAERAAAERAAQNAPNGTYPLSLSCFLTFLLYPCVCTLSSVCEWCHGCPGVSVSLSSLCEWCHGCPGVSVSLSSVCEWCIVCPGAYIPSPVTVSDV